MSDLRGCGLGFRRDWIEEFLSPEEREFSFIECAPENWMGIGGRFGRVFAQVAERFPITAHGLSLSLGSPEPLDRDFIGRLKRFLDQFKVGIYSEHLSFSKCDNAHLYELLPVPFRRDAVKHIANRIRLAQEMLGRRIAIENVSYYTPLMPEMDEASFIRAVVEEAECDLLLDVNNVYVNAFNHGYDARRFIESLPLERVAYVHMAGHTQRTPNLIIDTHGEAIIDPVYELLEFTLHRLHPVPVLLERDYHFPVFAEIEGEVRHLKRIMERCWRVSRAA